MCLKREEESFKNLVLLRLSVTSVQIHKPGFLSYWESYVFHLSPNLWEVVVLNTSESGGKPRSYKCLCTSLISTLRSDIHTLELLNKLKHGQDSDACDRGQVTIPPSFNPREGKKPHLAEKVNTHFIPKHTEMKITRV